MKRIEYIFVTLIALSFISGALVYSLLPDTMATHWNAEGVADGFSQKDISSVFLLPICSLLLLGLMLILPKIAVFKANWEKFYNAYQNFIAVMLTYMLFIQIVMYVSNLGFNVPVGTSIMAGISGLFFYISFFMEKVKRNFFAGIRTPWTLANDKVWDKTHKKGAIVFRVWAIAFLLLALISGKYAVYGLLVLIFGGIIYLFAYSYLEYKKIGVNTLETKE